MKNRGDEAMNCRKIKIEMVGISAINIFYTGIFGAICLILFARYQQENVLFFPLLLVVSGQILAAGG